MFIIFAVVRKNRNMRKMVNPQSDQMQRRQKTQLRITATLCIWWVFFLLVKIELSNLLPEIVKLHICRIEYYWSQDEALKIIEWLFAVHFAHWFSTWYLSTSPWWFRITSSVSWSKCQRISSLIKSKPSINSYIFLISEYDSLNPYLWTLNLLNPLCNFILYISRHDEIRLGVVYLLKNKYLTDVALKQYKNKSTHNQISVRTGNHDSWY